MNINHPPNDSSTKEWQYHGLIKLLLDSLPSKNQRKKHLRIIEKATTYESAYEKCMIVVEKYNDNQFKFSKKRREKGMYVAPRNNVVKYEPKEIVVLEPYKPQHFDIEALKKYCWASKESFEKIYRSYPEMTTEVVTTSNGLKYIYHSRPGSTLLFVAHLDFVCGSQTYKQEGNKFYLQNLDDRLGAYLICAGLPYLINRDIKFDVLFTDGEETGRSTAKFFSKDKCKNEYSWMAEFDRRSDDVVMYSYETPELRKLLIDNGFKVGVGSYTDIESLQDLGIKGFNFGVGYQNNHSPLAYFEGDVLDKQMELMAAFINKYATTKFPHEKKEYMVYSSWRYYSDSRESFSGYRNGNNTPKNTYTVDKGIIPGNKILILNDDGVFVEKVKCKICENNNCAGLKTCKECNIDFHNSMIVNTFGICFYCLQEKYGVNGDVLHIIREFSFSTDKKFIYEEVEYDKEDITQYISQIKGIINEVNRQNKPIN